MNAQFVQRSRTAAIAADVRERIVAAFWFLLPLLAAAAILASAAHAATTTGPQRRVALVIGNSSYQYAPHLPNPGNDAEAVAASLQQLGFEVTKGIDLDRSETELIIKQFAKTLPGADVALLFYAGHGIQVGTKNYLVPVDAQLGFEVTKGIDLDRSETELIIKQFAKTLPGAEVALLFYAGHGIQVGTKNYLVPVDAQLGDETDLSFEATDLDLVLNVMSREPRVNLVFLDACRDNPFAQTLARSMGSTRSTSIGRGLAIVQATAGSFIAYATDPDQVALDGNGSHSPFTAALLAHMASPGQSISDMMIAVRNDVLTATQQRQRPWDTSSLTSPFYFMPAVATTETVATTVAPTETAPAQGADREVVFWQSVQSSNSAPQYQAYLDQYPNGTFAPLARTRIDELKAKPADTTRSPDQQVASLTTPDATVSTAEETERGIGLTKPGRSRVQLALTLLGYKTGGTDGSFGPKTRTAISAWQSDQHETATGYLTPKQHAALLDAAAPQLAAWDVEQKRKLAEAQAQAQQQAAADAANPQQNAGYGTASTTQPTRQLTQDRQAAAQAEADRLRLENERLKNKQAQAQEDRQNVQIGVGLFNTVVGGVSLFK